MKIEIYYEKSNKALDSIVRFDEPTLEKLFWREIISFETPNNSQENITKWLSEDRKKEFEKKLNESDIDNTYKITEIKISTLLP
jgi:hypothetical protein